MNRQRPSTSVSLRKVLHSLYINNRTQRAWNNWSSASFRLCEESNKAQQSCPTFSLTWFQRLSSVKRTSWRWCASDRSWLLSDNYDLQNKLTNIECEHLYFFPRGLAFTWWGGYGLCLWHIQTELAHSFLFCSYVYFCPYGPFNCISFHKFSQQLSVFFTLIPVLSLPYWSFK